MFHIWVQSIFATEPYRFEIGVMEDINLKFPMDTSLSSIVDGMFGGDFEREVNNMCCFTTHFNRHHIDPDDDDALLGWDLKWGDIPRKKLTILAFDSWACHKVITHLSIHTVVPSDDDEEVKKIEVFQTPSTLYLWTQIKALKRDCHTENGDS